MTSLLIVAHGSRREASNDEVRALAGIIRDRVTDYDSVEPAFLELAEPSIPDGIRAAIKNGSKKVIVLPYFLSAGRHVTEDIPADIKVVQDESPDVDIVLAPYVGAADGIVELLLNQASL
jgi:sirohydrochlorin ferrochelatase